MKDYIIGIDMGINNVGWAVLDNETKTIENYGVRLFNPSSDAKNRRIARNTRRRMKRKDTRVNDVLKLLSSIGFPSKITIDTELIKKRYDGISKKIEKQDITNILCYMVSNRGYIPFGDEEASFVDLKGKLPCEYYYDMYIKEGRYHDTTKTVKNTDNINEMKQLLKEQSKYYNDISTDFIEKYIEIFSRKRKFWEGPGSINSLTPFGRFKTKEDVTEYINNKKNNPNYEKYIFEDLVANCKIAIGEKCAPKLNLYVELFNMYNDFINISFKDISELDNKDCFNEVDNKTYKLNEKGLNEIYKYCINNYKLKYTDIFKNLFATNIDNIIGYRIDKNKKPEFSTLKYYRLVCKTFSENNFDISWTSDIQTYNEIMKVMTIAPGTVEFLKLIENNDKITNNFSDSEKQILKELYIKFKKESMLSYSSLSEKILMIAIKDMVSLQKNFMQVRRLKNYDKKANEFFINEYKKESHNKLHISLSFIDEIIASPQVKKSLRQSINVINAIIDKYGLPKTIAIESTKDLNGSDKKKEIEDEQRKQENLRKNAQDFIIKNFGESKANETNIIKVMLYDEMDGHCAYCNKPININDLLSEGYQIEHILPISKSLNDSYNNKTISCKTCNKNKGNNTPYQFLGNNFESFEKRIRDNKNISTLKKDNLLFVGDIDKYTTRFFNRNLRDTAYATTELINQINIFNNYIKTINEDYKVNTMSTPGQITHKIRNELDLIKDRDDGKYHHAVDASIVASIATTDIGEIIIDSQNNRNFWIKNREKDIKNSDYLKKVNIKDIKVKIKKDEDNTIIDDIKKIDNFNTKLSFQVIKNPQKQLANTKTYKIIKKNDKYYKIDQIDDIYNFDFSIKTNVTKFESLLDENDEKLTLLCYDKDKDTFNMLKDIYNKYKNEKGNPYINYLIDIGSITDSKMFDANINGIRMVSKENKGPIIKRLRYYTVINDPYLLEKDNINKKMTTFLAMDSLALFCTSVYVDLDKKQFIFLPIYSISVDLKTKQINKNNQFYKLFYDKYIGTKNVKYIVDLYNGDTIEKIKYDKDGNKQIVIDQFQGFHKTLNKLVLKSGSAVTKSDTSLTVYYLDILGNIKNKLTYKIN